MPSNQAECQTGYEISSSLVGVSVNMKAHTQFRLRNRLVSMWPWLAELMLYARFGALMFVRRKQGWLLPPLSLVKRSMLRREAIRLQANTFVETGTYLGDTTWYLRTDFKRLISIEVEANLAAIARDRFSGHPHISIVEGDSGTQLSVVVPTISPPVLFWLDGHYSAGITGRGNSDCPIWEELAAISGRTNLRCSIFIDDARCFGSDSAYPTISEMQKWCHEHLPRQSFSVENDIIIMRAE